MVHIGNMNDGKANFSFLFISAFPPNQKTAGQDYSRRLLNDLVQKGYPVSLVYAEYPGHEVELDPRIKILASFTPRIQNCACHPSVHPFFTRRFDDSVLGLLKSRASEFDVLYFDFSQVHLYACFIDHPCKILMCHDVIFQKYSRAGCWKIHLPWIRCSEKALLSVANQIVTFSQKDCDVIKREYALDSASVNFYLKNGRFDHSKNIVLKKNMFCFYGAWNRTENSKSLLWFLEKVLPLVRGDFQFAVIGGGMPPHLKKKLKSNLRMKYIGFVDEPVYEIAKCQALIAPLKKGAGVKVKVIDSLSSGTPVVGTDIAFEGITDNTENRLFVPCDSVQDFASALNNWRTVSTEFKQAAANEFFDRYNSNHFPDTVLPHLFSNNV